MITYFYLFYLRIWINCIFLISIMITIRFLCIYPSSCKQWLENWESGKKCIKVLTWKSSKYINSIASNIKKYTTTAQLIFAQF